jgi:hypothetical protein
MSDSPTRWRPFPACTPGGRLRSASEWSCTRGRSPAGCSASSIQRPCS